MTENVFDPIDEFKRRLEQRLNQLSTLDKESRESRSTVTLDQSKVGRLSRMDAMQQQAMAAETAQRRKIEMQRIGAALRRIQTGDFGYCLRCEEEISLPRLEQDPSTPLCINCARQQK